MTTNAYSPWVHTTDGFRVVHSDPTLGPIVGAVPGTPAAEPPAHVLKVRDSEGDVVERRDGGWWDTGCGNGDWVHWGSYTQAYGPYTEVLPE